MKNVLVMGLLALSLAGAGWAQEVDPDGPVLQVNGENSSVIMGKTVQGRGILITRSPRGSVLMMAPRHGSASLQGTSGAGRSAVYQGASGPGHSLRVFQGGGARALTSGQGAGGDSGEAGVAGSAAPSDVQIRRGPAGELEVSDPSWGRVVIGRGPQGTTTVQTAEGTYRISNELLNEFLEKSGRDVLKEQLEGR